MKDIYVILAFHAHELLWDLPEKLLSYLDESNPMKEGITGDNYLRKRKDEGRDIYSLCSETGERIKAPMCVEYTNELLVQIKDVMPKAFARLKEDYKRGRLYPIYGHAHHSHVSLLSAQEMTQDILWNSFYLHNEMGVPYPTYQGLFPTEDSLDSKKMNAIEDANIDYVIFPHLEKGKVPFSLEGQGDFTYTPFLLGAGSKKIIALPRNFPISQEIWRPITKMKRNEVKSQGYMLGEFPVFNNEYLTGDQESYPISMEIGVEMYKDVIRQEIEQAPQGGLLLYVQDLELMDFGDIALEIMEKAWTDIISESQGKYKIHFVTPDDYINKVLVPQGIAKLPTINFEEISWAPEIRLILRADGHYPPLGVTGVGPYDDKKTGIYDHPHIFWENGKYFCGIFDHLLKCFNITVNVPLDMVRLGDTEYDLREERLDSQAVMYLRLMKRACNWGWRPTEGRQKRPCLLGYLLCDTLLRIIEEKPAVLAVNSSNGGIDSHHIVGLAETLRVFIGSRVNYLNYGLESYAKEKVIDMTKINHIFKEIEYWKNRALEKAQRLYEENKEELNEIQPLLKTMQEYCQAVYMATDHIQRLWGEAPDTEYLVDKMYHYLYKIYPPIFPGMIDRIDSLSEDEIARYFAKEAVTV